MDATHNFRGYNRPLPVMQLLNDDFSFDTSDTVTTYHAHHEYYILMFNVIHIIDYIHKLSDVNDCGSDCTFFISFRMIFSAILC